MLRRQARLRREYLYRKSLEGKEKEEYERKRQVKEALAEGKPLPTEVRRDEAAGSRDRHAGSFTARRGAPASLASAAAPARILTNMTPTRSALSPQSPAAM